MHSDLAERNLDDLPVVFISAVANKNLALLKDVLWKELNSESNKLQSITAEDRIVHRDKDMAVFNAELEAEGETDIVFVDDEEVEELEDYEIEDLDEE